MRIDITSIRWSVLLVLTVLFCTGVGCRTLPSHAPFTFAKEPDELRIHFFNVGVGAMALIECPADSLDRPILIDGGSVSGNTTSSAPVSYLLGYLGKHPNKKKTRQKLKQILNGRAIDLIITHPHADHANWIPDLLDSVQVKHILLGGRLKAYKGSLFFPINIKKWVERKPIPITYADMQPGWHNGGNPLGDNHEEPKIEGFGCGAADVYVLTVNSPKMNYPVKSHSNLNSAVILVRYKDFRAIFPGDAEGLTQKTALANLDHFDDFALDDSTFRPITVLAAAHHGTSTAHSNDTTWVKATQPRVVVYSAGTWYGHPHCKTTKRYGKYLFEFGQGHTVKEHPFHCGRFGTFFLSSFKRRNSKRAEFVTHLNGDVVITTKGCSHLQLEYGLTKRFQETVPYPRVMCPPLSRSNRFVAGRS